MLMLFNFLMRMHRERSATNFGKGLGATLELTGYLQQTFTSFDRGQTQISRENKAKIICWLCILALKTSPGCIVEAEALAAIASDLKITVAELLPYFREVGCVTANREKCKLKAPLQLPELGGGKKRRR